MQIPCDASGNILATAFLMLLWLLDTMYNPSRTPNDLRTFVKNHSHELSFFNLIIAKAIEKMHHLHVDAVN